MSDPRVSPQQKRLHLEISRGTVCNTVILISIDGPASAVQLREALQELVACESLLRTEYRLRNDSIEPVEAEQSDVEWTEVDLQALEPGNQRASFDALIDRERNLAFPQRVNVRASLVSLSVGRRKLVIALPALLSDTQSAYALVERLGFQYAGENAAQIAINYGQIAQWFNELLTLCDDDARRGKAFWKRISENASQAIELPEKRGTSGPPRWESIVTSVPRQTAEELAQSGPVENCLLAAWQLLISRLTGCHETTLAAFAAGRNYEGLENALGLVGRWVPVRVQVEPNLRFADLINLANTQAAQVAEWQIYFDLSVHSTISPLGFEYHVAPKAATYGGVEFGVERVWGCTERFALKLGVEGRESGLQLEFAYDAGRLERTTVERWSRHFLTLLRAALARPETAVSRLPLLEPEERAQLLYGWNETAADYPRNRCLHELFEEQAARTPERTAVQCGEQKLTYEELNRKANRVAHALSGMGVGAGSRVGLCLERGVAMLVAVLGIGKAGAAYVPLSADQPRARLEQQMGGLAAVVSEEKLQAQLPALAGPVLRLDPDFWQGSEQPETNPQVPLDAEDLVYVIYTSGSTGAPKGVGIRHRNLVNYATFIARRLELENYPEGLRFATVSTLSADLGNTCIYPALITGGTVHVVPYEVATDSRQLGRYMERYAIDVLKIVPSHLGALLETGGGAGVLPRKYLILGGETLTRALVEKIAGLQAACEVINHYGPTETTVGSLTLRLKEYDWKRGAARSIPIGRPIANTRIYILDAEQEPVPVGVTGELYIAGDGVGAGYVDLGEKTEERFLRDRFVEDAKARMYRTGDQARYLEDGVVEFVGRGDDQVKIRGFRVELGEIEAVLGRYAGVQQAVVLARDDGGGEKRLAAYVVCGKDAKLDREALHEYLAQHLPEYMIPAAVVALAKLPLTANGKVDRQALPVPEQAAGSRGYVAPRTPTEQMVAQIWADVLRLEKVGIHDNFFQIGGHSLKATQVISRVRKELRKDLAIRLLFEQPTVHEIAKAMDALPEAVIKRKEPQLTRVSRDSFRAGGLSNSE
jgi:amino acid adenylation domain-containing protein